MAKSVLHTIESNMKTFSKGQKKIAAYILENYDKAAFMTASKLGSLVGVSESTVVRFASELGYEGYMCYSGHIDDCLYLKRHILYCLKVHLL